MRWSSIVKVLDHDMEPDGLLLPFGILEVKQKQFNIVYGNSVETSDFIVDSPQYWWRYRKHYFRTLKDYRLTWTTGRSWRAVELNL